MDYLPVAHIRAIQTAKYIPTTWTEAIVSSTPLGSRKWLEIYNRSPYKLYYSYDSTLNSESAFAIKAGGKFIAPLSEHVPLYLKNSQASGNLKVIIAEIS